MYLTGPAYQRLIPRRYWLKSAARRHRFSVGDPWWSPYEIAILHSGALERFEPSAYCQLLVGDSYASVLLPLSRYPRLGGAVLEFGKLLSTGSRAQRYMTLFKVYETISDQPEIQFSAVRHALAHASAVLNKPKTVGALVSLFGTTHVDLSRSDHQAAFWRVFGELLVKVDDILGAQLRVLVNVIYMPSSHRQPITIHVAGHCFPEALSELLSNPPLNTDEPQCGAPVS